MPYDDGLAARVDALLADRDGIREQKMFGGIAWMLNGNMALGIVGDELMVRVARDEADDALAEPHTRVMDMTGRPMKGFILVALAATRDDAGLRAWVERGLAYAASLPPK